MRFGRDDSTGMSRRGFMVGSFFAKLGCLSAKRYQIDSINQKRRILCLFPSSSHFLVVDRLSYLSSSEQVRRVKPTVSAIP